MNRWNIGEGSYGQPESPAKVAPVQAMQAMAPMEGDDSGVVDTASIIEGIMALDITDQEKHMMATMAGVEDEFNAWQNIE